MILLHCNSGMGACAATNSEGYMRVTAHDRHAAGLCSLSVTRSSLKPIQVGVKEQGACLAGEADAAGVLIKYQQALGAEARVVGVVALCAQVSRVAEQEEGHHIDECVAGAVQALTEGQAPLRHLPPR